MKRLIIGSILVLVAIKADLPRRILNTPTEFRIRSLTRKIESEEQELRNLDFQISANSEFSDRVRAMTPPPPPMCGGRPMIVVNDGSADKQEFLYKMSGEIGELNRQRQELQDQLNNHRQALRAAKRGTLDD
jgi:hypothetical protein